ncbi:MAG: hypothetical protein JF615_11840 [Asticcacaulis sp.]|nr:hypothetical protein [Asticcacaulis sp.]
MKSVAVVLSAVLLMAGAAQAATPPPEVVDAVAALIDDGWPPADIDEPEAGAPLPPKADTREVRRWQRKGLLKPVHLTPGPGPDWLIDTEKSERPAAWCGTGGCMIEIWAPGPDGHYVKILHQQLRYYRVRPIPGADRGWLETDFHGSICNLAGVEACPWGFEWRDDGLGPVALRSSLRFVTAEGIHSGPPPQALDPEDDGGDAVPAEIQTVLMAQQTACRDMKAELAGGGLVNRMPDLNGDGIDDWSYDGRYLACDYPGGTPAEMDTFDWCTKLDCEAYVWVSRRVNGGVAWQPVEMAAGGNYALVLHPGKPATLVALTVPASGAPCDLIVMDDCARTAISLSPKP